MIDPNGGIAWFAEAQALLRRIIESQAEVLEEAARLCAACIAADGLVHLFGTGHSRIPVEEMFPRYGSFPGFHPIVELSMTYHTNVVGSNGQRQAMFIERVPGLAEVILDNFSFGPHDVMIDLQRQRPDGRAGGDGPRRTPSGHEGHRRHRPRAVARGRA